MEGFVSRRSDSSEKQFVSSQIERETIGDLQESAFRSLVLDELTNYFDECLAESKFSDEEIETIEESLAALSYDDALKVMSTPKENAERKFSRIRENLLAKRITLEDVVPTLLEESKKYGFGVGYHSSPFEIRPEKDGRWFIKPTENDHRDDLTMAYFATSYKTLYRKRMPKYLYLVRTIAENTRTDGNWSRSSGMSVIASMPMDRVDGWVDRVVSENIKKNSVESDAA